jgi:hypothetical protein
MVVFSITDEKYKYLMKTIDSFKGGIRILSMNQVYKQSLMKDIYAIESILKTAKKGDSNGHNENNTNYRGNSGSVISVG